AYRYGRYGNLTDVAFADATSVFAAASFGTGLQNLLGGSGSGFRLLSVAPAPASERMQAGVVNPAEVSDVSSYVEMTSDTTVICYAPEPDDGEVVVVDGEIVCYAPEEEAAPTMPMPSQWNWSHAILNDFLRDRHDVLGDMSLVADSYQDVVPRSLVAAAGAHGRAEMGRRLHVAD
ncbi:MAG TPA: hypothetical protein VK629_00995, partial [Steroidobacteraceae bacterium]|nr:hypothetical protein [Steroidobacteraceae bacterium]